MKGNRKSSFGKHQIGKKIITVLFCIGVMVVIGIGIFLHTHFEKTLSDTLIKASGKGISPRFYTYSFTDRKNREGVAKEVTQEIFLQESSEYIAYTDIPPDLIHAFVAIEDHRFFDHRGIDWMRTAAAGLNYVLGFSDQFGASTITQQLIKNLTGHDEIRLSRKLQEILYAIDLERRLDKTEIMERYLNIIHFSDNCNGISAAADHYYSKSVQELTLSEIATIAAITNSPTYYNPIHHPDHNLERRNLILSQMYRYGYITEEAYRNASESPIALNVRDRGQGNRVNSWYVDMVIDDVISDLMTKYGLERAAASRLLYSGGLSIEMAMDEEIQKSVTEYYRDAVRLPHNAEGESAQSALIVIDPHTGDILAVAGAIGEKNANRVQNFATQTLRPPGSAIKPISIYAPALEEGLINWASVYDDTPTDFDIAGKLSWPKNATGEYRGLTNVAYAVAHSTNTVPVRILRELGEKNAYQWARERFHLASMVSNSMANDCDTAALALGQLNYGITLRELTAAYSVFADAGRYHPWRSYFRVVSADGQILLDSPDRSEIVLSEANAAIMTKLLQGVIEYGTSSSITLGRLTECAGKTGTTNGDADRWFVGYTPDFLCGVWCGYAYPEPLVGRNLCTTIWNRVMWDIVEQKGENRKFSVPSNVIRVTYCRDSGELLDECCLYDVRGDRAQAGWFVAGTEPKTHCTCHILCEYDASSGGINHGNCPTDSIERVSLIRVLRQFPIPVYVTDAQYTWFCDPHTVAPNEDGTRAYYTKLLQGYTGISPVKQPFNRSCMHHTQPPEREMDWSYLFPRISDSDSFTE